ncbi:mechanosensitive ion channel domain-containing protein [Nitrosomonas sp.]|uniref:mechanosensitive ion channel domain-containing protein n=1 Tax=Nitrosomonas sp. TaxID=42353 RepID=UPI0020836727|nr:mechanosensitive ion channel domain-containing protein [Nitrosomonas sp.]GJL75863.1 MAG: potassium transporter [Nitrosomonas sp.]
MSVLCLIFISFGNAVLAADKQNSYADIEAALKEKRSGFNLTLKDVEERIATLKKIESLNPQQQSELSSLIQAHDFLHKSIESVDQALHYVESSQDAPQQLKALEQKLDAPLQQDQLKIEDIDLKEPLEKLETQFDAIRKILENAQKARAEIETKITRRAERQPKIQEALSTAHKRIEELKQKTTTVPDMAGNNFTETQKIAQSVELGYLTQLLKELELEDRSYNQQRELLRAQRHAAERSVLIAERNYNVFEQIINEMRSEAAARAKQVADTASLAADTAHPLVRAIINENKLLATELEELTEDGALLSKEKKRLGHALTKTEHTYNRIREKIAQTGLTNAIGLKLRNDLKQLPDIGMHEKKIELRNLEINRVQLRRIELEDRLLDLVDLNQEALQLMADAKIELTEDAHNQLQAAVYQALDRQKEDYLDELINAYDVYFENKLYPLLEKELKFVALIKDYKEFIDTRILWIQSAPVIELGDIQRLGTATAWLLNPSSWIQTITFLGNDFHDNFLTVMPLLLFIALLLGMQRYLRRRLSEFGRYVTKLSKAQFTDTLWAVVVTLLMALAWPLFIYLIAWRIQQMESDSTFILAIGCGLTALAYLLFSGLVLRHICRKEGLGELHFRWKVENMRLIRQQLAWYLSATLPLIFVFVVTLEQPTEAHHDSLGRLVFFILMVATTLLIYRLMHPASGLLKNYLEKHSEGWISRLTGLWFPVLLITPTVLAITAAGGYTYTAGQLSLHIINSILLIFAVIVARALLIRWLNIVQRKLAIEQWRKKLAAQAEQAQEDDKTKTADTGEQIHVEEDELDVAVISTQTMKLLNTAYWFTIVIGLALIWAQVLPAFNMLNEVVLWNTEVTSTDSGSETKSLVPITLASLLLAIVIFMMTFFISNNIPGLLEIVILQRLPFTPSGRYAIASIARYFIIIFGFAMTFSALGIGWSKVQWLAAAVTVGLGFGLQEIFANFVSGLIILFERPVRVGDVVTLGNISGKVSRIQMRATTIIDWDRKELIIPNKEFVTGQVINWSLSDSILRILIPVGIAYGSDTKLANDILLSIAQDHPNVLKEPESSARFVAFGDSSLNFELRVFIPEPDLLLETRHDLLMEIDRRFREAKIEIAFPHQDIHIRSLPEQISIVSRSITAGQANGQTTQ